MSTYSTVEDLLLTVALPRDLPVQRYVDDARDEIDSALGHLYVTPFDLCDSGPMARHSKLLIKRIANHLATGRIIMAVAMGTEDNTNHAYGAGLVKGALAALESLRTGAVVLEDAPLVERVGTGGGDMSISQHDATSIMDTFEQAFMGAPGGTGILPPVWRPGGGDH